MISRKWDPLLLQMCCTIATVRFKEKNSLQNLKISTGTTRYADVEDLGQSLCLLFTSNEKLPYLVSYNCVH